MNKCDQMSVEASKNVITKISRPLFLLTLHAQKSNIKKTHTESLAFATVTKALPLETERFKKARPKLFELSL